MRVSSPTHTHRLSVQSLPRARPRALAPCTRHVILQRTHFHSKAQDATLAFTVHLCYICMI
jgi:hypothetical protein